MKELDLLNPAQITKKTLDMLKEMGGKIDHILFCHGVINFFGGIDGSF